SIAGSLDSMLGREPLPGDWREDARRGLTIIASRSESLSRFLSAYAQLAKLPRPTMARDNLGELIRQAAALEQRIPVEVEPGPDMFIQGDRDQLEQAVINLVRNAVDASLETSGNAAVMWTRRAGNVEIAIRDQGQGISNTANLFVPFFTTKPG